MTDTNQLPPHTITINDHPEPHIMQWSDLELAAIKKYAESYALQALAQAHPAQAEVTDERLLEIGREWTKEVGWYEFEVNDFIGCARAVLALRPTITPDLACKSVQARLAAQWGYVRPAEVPMTPREIELIDGMIAVQLDHAQRCDAIGNRVMGEKQKGWDMERVELLRRIRSFGITAQAKKEAP